MTSIIHDESKEENIPDEESEVDKSDLVSDIDEEEEEDDDIISEIDDY